MHLAKKFKINGSIKNQNQFPITYNDQNRRFPITEEESEYCPILSVVVILTEIL